MMLSFGRSPPSRENVNRSPTYSYLSNDGIKSVSQLVSHVFPNLSPSIDIEVVFVHNLKSKLIQITPNSTADLEAIFLSKEHVHLSHEENDWNETHTANFSLASRKEGTVKNKSNFPCSFYGCYTVSSSRKA